MLRRDRITLGVLMGMCAANVAVCAVACYFFVRQSRRCDSAISDFKARVESAERVCADAAGAALALADSRAFDSSDGSSASGKVEPRILGFGQSRSVSAYYPYCDVEYPDGTVQRRYLARVPIEDWK